MLYRTSAKAKLGQVIFINSELYDIAYDFFTLSLDASSVLVIPSVYYSPNEY